MGRSAVYRRPNITSPADVPVSTHGVAAYVTPSGEKTCPRKPPGAAEAMYRSGTGRTRKPELSRRSITGCTTPGTRMETDRQPASARRVMARACPPPLQPRIGPGRPAVQPTGPRAHEPAPAGPDRRDPGVTTCQVALGLEHDLVRTLQVGFPRGAMEHGSVAATRSGIPSHGFPPQARDLPLEQPDGRCEAERNRRA